MIVIPNASAEKAKFKKVFKYYDDVSLKIIPDGNKGVQVRIHGSSSYPHHKEDTMVFFAQYDNAFHLQKTIQLLVDTCDCVWDVLFDKCGFLIEYYENAYGTCGLRTISESGTEGWISHVIFRTMNKKRDFLQPCNNNWKVITD